MEKTKDFNEWRAKQLGYVYLSRLNNLIIQEANTGSSLFDYLIDIGESGKQTGRLLAVKVNALNDTSIDICSLAKQSQNILFPLLLIAFDNKTDQGYFTWIKEPQKDGRLLLGDATKNFHKLENDSLNKIVKEVEEWYSYQQVDSH